MDVEIRRRYQTALLDPRGRTFRFERGGSYFVGKRCPRPAGHRERERASEAQRRLGNRRPPTLFPLEVVIPDLTAADGAEEVLVARDLGEPLSVDVSLARRLLPLPRLIVVLATLLDAGVEAPGFVPRNMFHRDGRVHVIDWEDAEFTGRPASPSQLTVMKWDIAWSDVFEADPALRLAFADRLRDGPPPDSFERALGELVDPELTSRQLRARGVALTLASELHVPGVGDVTAAELGHLADEILPAQHSVLYTALTARVRTVAGEQGYARFVDSVWQAVRDQRIWGPDVDTAEAAAGWLRAVFTAADDCLSSQTPLTDLHRQLVDLAEQRGWDAARRRAALAEGLLVQVSDLVVSALGLTGLHLILRGSLAQAVVSRGSDLDFELSGSRHPHGHRPVERLVLDILAAFGLQAEASEGRPAEADIRSPGGGLARDLHEWMELRRPGSDLHDPGWLNEHLDPPLSLLLDTQSAYERASRQLSAKYLWFEVRALLARLAFRHATGRPPATAAQQLRLLRDCVGESDAVEIRDLLMAALALREQDDFPLVECIALQDRASELRRRAGLPGPSQASG